MTARNTVVLVPLAALSALALTQCAQSQPPVRSSAAAVATAKAAWSSVHSKVPWEGRYSAANVARFEPYTASLSGGVWTVTGTVVEGISIRDMPLARVRQSDGATDVSNGL